ncbi:MAG: hypothetical protein RL722_2517, partial [Pseudomonadota bacterium]
MTTASTGIERQRRTRCKPAPPARGAKGPAAAPAAATAKADPLKVALLLRRRFRDPGLERTLRRVCAASSLDLQLLSGHAAPVMSDMGYLVDPTLPLGLCPADLDLLVVPGAPREAAEPARDPALVRWLSS